MRCSITIIHVTEELIKNKAARAPSLGDVHSRELEGTRDPPGLRIATLH